MSLHADFLGPTTNNATLQLLRQASSGMIVDALRRARIDGAIDGILPAPGFRGTRLLAPATTVAYGPLTDSSPRLNMYQVIRDSAPGSVLVIDGRALHHHFVGDNMGHCAKVQGLAGIVVNGGARDLAGFRDLDLPLYCRGPAVTPFPQNFGIVARDQPVHLGTVDVSPGDVIVADDDGVVTIPSAALPSIGRHLAIVLDVERKLDSLIADSAPVDSIIEVLDRKKPG